MNNPFSGNSSIAGPCSQSVNIDAGGKSDSPGTQLSSCIRALYCGTGGTVKFHVLGDPTTTTYTISMAAGQTLDLFYIDQIYVTGTTATGLIGGV